MTWAALGSSWEIAHPQVSGIYLRSGTRGLNMPPLTRRTSSSPGLHGSRWRGWIAEEREVFWPLSIVNQAGSAQWLEHDRAFWATLRPDVVGTWTVVQPGGEYRSLSCRYADDGNQSFDIDPMLTGWAQYGVTLAAEQPFWAGPTITRSWGTRDGEPNVYPNPGDDYVLYISAGFTVGSATITNPGDVDAWPTWTVRGPYSTASLGVAGGVIDLDVALGAGQSATVYTDPARQVVIDQDGVDRTDSWFGDRAEFRPVPPGETVNLTLELNGDGSVQCSLDPLYYRAW